MTDSDQTWRCASCDEEHSGLATVFGPEAPDPWLMATTEQHWSDPDRAALPPMFGWLANELGLYDQPTALLAAHVHTRPPGMAPFVELDPSLDHPLVREQVDGISLHRVAELNRQIMGG